MADLDQKVAELEREIKQLEDEVQEIKDEAKLREIRNLKWGVTALGAIVISLLGFLGTQVQHLFEVRIR